MEYLYTSVFLDTERMAWRESFILSLCSIYIGRGSVGQIAEY